MSGRYSPQRPPSHADCSGEMSTQDLRLQWLEERVVWVEQNQEEAAKDMAAIKIQIGGVHDDLERVESTIQRTEEKLTRAVASAGSLVKWIAGIVCSVGIALGVTMFTTCHESSRVSTRTQTVVEGLSEDVRDLEKNFNTLRQFLLTGRGQDGPDRPGPLNQL